MLASLGVKIVLLGVKIDPLGVLSKLASLEAVLCITVWILSAVNLPTPKPATAKRIADNPTTTRSMPDPRDVERPFEGCKDGNVSALPINDGD
jgi:hypothetical protein